MIGRLGALAGLAALAWAGCASAPAASAQNFWNFSGMKFPARDSWCSKQENQGTADKSAWALEARRCGSDFPYMSVGSVDAGGQLPGVSELIANGTDYASTPDAHKVVLDLIIAKHTGCSEASYTVKKDAMTGVPGFAVEANFKCSDSPTPVLFRNWTTYAVTKSGKVWIVAFDYPTEPITGGDIAMIQSAIQTISSAP